MNVTIPWFHIIGTAACWFFLGWRGAVGFILGSLLIAAWRSR